MHQQLLQQQQAGGNTSFGRPRSITPTVQPRRFVSPTPALSGSMLADRRSLSAERRGQFLGVQLPNFFGPSGVAGVGGGSLQPSTLGGGTTFQFPQRKKPVQQLVVPTSTQEPAVFPVQPKPEDRDEVSNARGPITRRHLQKNSFVPPGNDAVVRLSPVVQHNSFVPSPGLGLGRQQPSSSSAVPPRGPPQQQYMRARASVTDGQTPSGSPVSTQGNEPVARMRSSELEHVLMQAVTDKMKTAARKRRGSSSRECSRGRDSSGGASFSRFGQPGGSFGAGGSPQGAELRRRSEGRVSSPFIRTQEPTQRGRLVSGSAEEVEEDLLLRSSAAPPPAHQHGGHIHNDAQHTTLSLQKNVLQGGLIMSSSGIGGSALANRWQARPPVPPLQLPPREGGVVEGLVRRRLPSPQLFGRGPTPLATPVAQTRGVQLLNGGGLPGPFPAMIFNAGVVVPTGAHDQETFSAGAGALASGPALSVPVCVSASDQVVQVKALTPTNTTTLPPNKNHPDGCSVGAQMVRRSGVALKFAPLRPPLPFGPGVVVGTNGRAAPAVPVAFSRPLGGPGLHFLGSGPGGPPTSDQNQLHGLHNNSALLSGSHGGSYHGTSAAHNNSINNSALLSGSHGGSYHGTSAAHNNSINNSALLSSSVHSVVLPAEGGSSLQHGMLQQVVDGPPGDVDVDINPPNPYPLFEDEVEDPQRYSPDLSMGAPALAFMHQPPQRTSEVTIGRSSVMSEATSFGGGAVLGGFPFPDAVDRGDAVHSFLQPQSLVVVPPVPTGLVGEPAASVPSMVVGPPAVLAVNPPAPVPMLGMMGTGPLTLGLAGGAPVEDQTIAPTMLGGGGASHHPHDGHPHDDGYNQLYSITEERASQLGSVPHSYAAEDGLYDLSSISPPLGGSAAGLVGAGGVGLMGRSTGLTRSSEES